LLGDLLLSLCTMPSGSCFVGFLELPVAGSCTGTSGNFESNSMSEMLFFPDERPSLVDGVEVVVPPELIRSQDPDVPVEGSCPQESAGTRGDLLAFAEELSTDNISSVVDLRL
jgi:hypothetical protein